MDVRTDHQIVAFDENMMMLFSNAIGQVVATAQRPNVGSDWTIHCDGIDDVTAASRGAAIAAMTEHVLLILPGVGYSTLVQHGLAEMP